MISKAAFKELGSHLVNKSSLTTDFEHHSEFLGDATEFRGECEAIVLAENENDVVECIKFASKNDLTIVARGAGTGLSGGCVPNKGSIVLSTEKLKQLTIDPKLKIAVVGPGVITKQIKDEASQYNLTYPPDPASYAESTIGGNVAECAGGLRCKRFGVTKDYVLGIRGVTAAGEIIATGCYTEESGFNLTDIFSSSEGTLVVMTEITLRLVNSTPPGETFLVAFDRPKDAAQTVSDITGAGIIPSVLEFLDGDAAECSNNYEKTEGLDKAGAILLIESNPDGGHEQVKLIRQICEKNNCNYFRQESDPAKADQLWKVRRNLSKAVKSAYKLRISEDVAVPNSKIPALIEFVAEANARSQIRMNSFGHAGDGNIHVNYMSNEDTPAVRELIEQEIQHLFEKVVSLNGTLTGEHGVGLAKREFLELEFDNATLGCMKSFKEIFDPGHLLNPGKVFL